MRVIIVLLTAFLVSACANPTIRANVTAFFTPAISTIQARTIAVHASPGARDSSLEFLSYKPKIEGQLNLAGFNIAKAGEKPDYIALVSYGIEGTEQQFSSSVSGPFYGSIGIGSYGYGGGPFYGGSLGRTFNSQSWDEYIRYLTLDIVTAETARSQNPVRIYESKVKSVGRCPTVTGVFDQLLQAMFEDFPGVNGQTVFVSIPWDGSCK